MDNKDILLIVIALLGWTWGIIQFLINRRNQKRDKLVDRRYEAYSTYMKKMDLLMDSVRTNPNAIFGVSTDFLKKVMNSDVDQIDNALIEFNEKLIDYVRKSLEPLQILNQELNALLLICSKDLLYKIEDIKKLTTDFNNEVLKSLSMINPNDSNTLEREFHTLSHDERWLRFADLYEGIKELMRKEIGNK
jgi:hypothetical protein